MNSKSRGNPQLTFYSDIATHHLAKQAANRQFQTSAAVLASSRSIPLNKRLKQTLLLVCGHSNPRIRYLQINPIAATCWESESRFPSTVPPSVNFRAFESKLNRICRTLVKSAYITPKFPEQETCNWLWFFSTKGCKVARTYSIKLPRSKFSK